MKFDSLTHLKIISASQGYIKKYGELKRKSYNCSANIQGCW